MGRFRQLLEPKQTAADLSNHRYSKSNVLSFTYIVLQNIYEHFACHRDILMLINLAISMYETKQIPSDPAPGVGTTSFDI